MTIRQLLTAFKRVKVGVVDVNATDYLNEASGGKLIRFDKKILNVYFESTTAVAGYHENYQILLTEALDQWTSV